MGKRKLHYRVKPYYSRGKRGIAQRKRRLREATNYYASTQNVFGIESSSNLNFTSEMQTSQTGAMLETIKIEPVDDEPDQPSCEPGWSIDEDEISNICESVNVNSDDVVYPTSPQSTHASGEAESSKDSDLKMLSWSSHNRYLAEGFFAHFEEHYDTDFELCAKGKNGNEHVVKVHHLILSIFCPSLKGATEKKLNLDVNEDDLNVLVEFLYKGRFKLRNDQLNNVLTAANILGFKVLSEMIERFIGVNEPLVAETANEELPAVPATSHPCLLCNFTTNDSSNLQRHIHVKHRYVNEKREATYQQRYVIKKGEDTCQQRYVEGKSKGERQDNLMEEFSIDKDVPCKTYSRSRQLVKPAAILNVNQQSRLVFDFNLALPIVLLKEQKSAVKFKLNMLSDTVKNNTDAIHYFQKKGLLPNPKLCVNGHEMHLRDSQSWICSNIECKDKISLTANTIFKGSQLSFIKCLMFIYGWSRQLPSLHFGKYKLDTMSIMGKSDWCDKFREVCAFSVIRNSCQIGGPESTVEIDESMFYIMKGRIGPNKAPQQVFGGYCRESSDCFLVQVKNVSAMDLFRVIEKMILPGSTIIWDTWTKYKFRLSMEDDFQRVMVSRQYKFVTPETALQAQNSDISWKLAKLRNKIERGINTTHFEYDFCNFLWRRMNKSKDLFEVILQDIATHWPPM